MLELQAFCIAVLVLWKKCFIVFWERAPNFYKVGENMQENPQGITYYVDACTGSDTNDGLSPETAFYSLKAISALTLHAGDRVLLRRGCVFENQYLHLKM